MSNRSDGQTTMTMECEAPRPAVLLTGSSEQIRRPRKGAVPETFPLANEGAKKPARAKDEWVIDESTRKLYLSLLDEKEIKSRGGQVKPAPRFTAPPTPRDLSAPPSREESEPSQATIGLDDGAESTSRFLLYAAILIGFSFLIYKAISWSGKSTDQPTTRRHTVASRAQTNLPVGPIRAAARVESSAAAPQPSMASVTEPSVAIVPGLLLDSTQPGQSSTHTLTIYNGTPYELAYDVEARDLISQSGQAVYLPAGQTEGSVAGTLVYSTRTVDLKPMQSASLDITLTMPTRTTVRAVVITFQSRGSIPQGAQGTLAASPGSVIAITGLKGAADSVGGDTALAAATGSRIAISQWVVDTPKECHGSDMPPTEQAAVENPSEGIQ